MMIGAGSVVLHDIPDGALAYGVPARVVRQQVPADDTMPPTSSAQNRSLLLGATLMLCADPLN